MKLASLKSGRDGTLILVSGDLARGMAAPAIAPTLQHALERWESVEPHLRVLWEELNRGEALTGVFPLDPTALAAPLPRAYQWLDASAYVNHVELVRKSRGVEMPAEFWTDPLMYQGCSDGMLGPRDDIALADDAWGIDFEAELAVVTGDVPMGCPAVQAAGYIRLVMLVNDVSLRALALKELSKGFGFVQSKPASAFSPVAVTPDALGDAWRDGRVHLPLVTHYNGALFGKPDAGMDMVFNFPQLIAHAARTRHLGAGTIIGSGTVSNRNRAAGSSCIVEKRTIEKLETGESVTPFMTFGDHVRIEMLDAQGRSVFGAIEQKLVQYRHA